MNSSKTYVDGGQTAVLVAVITPGTGLEVTEEHLTELAFLAETAGIRTVKTFQQRLDHPDVRSFVG